MAVGSVSTLWSKEVRWERGQGRREDSGHGKPPTHTPTQLKTWSLPLRPCCHQGLHDLHARQIWLSPWPGLASLSQILCSFPLGFGPYYPLPAPVFHDDFNVVFKLVSIKCVCVCSHCLHKIPQTGWLKKKEFIYRSSGGCTSKIKVSANWFLVRTPFLAGGHPPSLCVFSW